MLNLLTFLIGGIAGRIRGGHLKDYYPSITTSHGRYVWGAVVALVFLLHTWEWFYAPIVGILAYIGTLWGYWGKFDLMRDDNRTVKNYALLTINGMSRMALLMIVFAQTPYFGAFGWAVMAGAFFVPCYMLGIYTYLKCDKLGHSQWGEFYFWGLLLAAMGAGL